jgi:hypothetical protein
MRADAQEIVLRHLVRVWILFGRGILRVRVRVSGKGLDLRVGVSGECFLVECKVLESSRYSSSTKKASGLSSGLGHGR